MNLRPIAAAILAITAVFATPSIAHAHEDLVQSDPTAGSEVAAGKFDITLTYSDELIQLEGGTGAEVVVTGPLEGESAIWSTGCLVINGREVSTTVDIDQPGTYRVAWRVVSNDGHPIDGTYEFTLVNDSNYVASELDACPPLVIAPAPPGAVGLGLFPITVGAGLVLIVTGAVLIPVLVAQRKRRSS